VAVAKWRWPSGGGQVAVVVVVCVVLEFEVESLGWSWVLGFGQQSTSDTIPIGEFDQHRKLTVGDLSDVDVRYFDERLSVSICIGSIALHGSKQQWRTNGRGR
jgi:hypothetical protein